MIVWEDILVEKTVFEATIQVAIIAFLQFLQFRFLKLQTKILRIVTWTYVTCCPWTQLLLDRNRFINTKEITSSESLNWVI